MLREPVSIDECIYFTNRSIGDGKIRAWIFRNKCPKCSKGLIGKPRDKKTVKVKIRAKEYVCGECGYQIPADEYEESLNVCVKYICPNCKYEGETEIPFKRKKIQVYDDEEMKKKTIDVIRFQCGGCGKNIDITKKMK